jgi:hypothetical protein
MKSELNPIHKARAALAKHPRCGAHCRTTGAPCRIAAMANGRCRMHGGKSTGRPVTHGQRTKAAKANRQKVKEVMGQLSELIITDPLT